MNLLLNRRWYTAESTIGDCTVGTVHECWILEDTRRAEKIYGKTCIPPGRYKITVPRSQRFNRILPILLNVPGYEGIRIPECLRHLRLYNG